MSLNPAIASTIANSFLINVCENRRLPRYEPTAPPDTAATTNGSANKGSCLVLLMLPRRPEIELTRINSAETADAVFVFAQRIKISKGVRNMPPPVPVNPESSPSPAPTYRAIGFEGSFGS